MTFRRLYNWPIIFSVTLHASIVLVGMVMADLAEEAERPRPAATSMHITMNAVETAVADEPKPEKPKPEKKQKPEPVLERVSVNKPKPTLPGQFVPKSTIQETQREKAPEAQMPAIEYAPETERDEQEATKQEVNQEALIIQAQTIGQQLAEQTLAAEIQYHDQVLSIIESHKFYSKRAQKMRQEGDVLITFTLNRDGSIQHLKVLDESAPFLLKKDALKTIRRSELFPSFPEGSARNTWSFQTTLSYTLR